MSTPIQAALLGAIQGLSEFLPVSSSAHLILARAFFGWDGDKFGLPFDVACHLGTLLAVAVYFRRDLADMVLALPRVLAPADHQAARLIWLLTVGTIPAVVVGVLFNRQIQDHLRTPSVAAAALALGGVGLLVADRCGRPRRTDASLTMAEAWWLGCAQAVALVPGVSRSGVTITCALLFGLHRPAAARVIFLLSIPAILGASAYEALQVARDGVGSGEASLFVVGVATSAVVGYGAVKYFIRYLAARGSLGVFAWYRFALAASVVIWRLR